MYILLHTNVTLARCNLLWKHKLLSDCSNIKNIIQNIDTEVYCNISLLFNKSDGSNLNFEVVGFTKVASEIPYTIPLNYTWLKYILYKCKEMFYTYTFTTSYLIPFQFTAMIRIPENVPQKDKMARLNQIVDELDIRGCLQTGLSLL